MIAGKKATRNVSIQLGEFRKAICSKVRLEHAYSVENGNQGEAEKAI